MEIYTKLNIRIYPERPSVIRDLFMVRFVSINLIYLTCIGLYVLYSPSYVGLIIYDFQIVHFNIFNVNFGSNLFITISYF